MSKYPFKGLVMEGGGPAGVGHVGAFEVLEREGILQNITHFVGSSAGAIAAMCLACRASAAFMKDKLFTLNFKDFLDGGCPLKLGYNFLRNYGLHKGDELEKWLGKILEELSGKEDLTFQEAYNKYGTFLEVTVADFTLGKTIYINHETHPDMQIKTAVRRSSMMVLLFQITREIKPTKFLDENNKIVSKDLVHLISDGGTLDNYPMHRLEELLPCEQIFGIKLVSSKQLYENNNPVLAKYPDHPDNIIKFLSQLYNIVREQALRLHVKEKYWERTIRVDVGSVSATDFDLDDTTKYFLIDQGKKAAQDFLERQNQ